MKKIYITTQKQLGKLTRVEKDEEVYIQVIGRLNASIEVYGFLRIETVVDMDLRRKIVARGSSRVVAWESSSVEAWESSSVVAWGSSRVVARESSSVEAWESSRVVAWESSSVVAWGSVAIHLCSATANIVLFGFSICFQMGIKGNITKKSKTCTVITPVNSKGLDGWLEREGIENKDNIVLFKKVSKDYKTQEATQNETLWTIGAALEHPSWNPKESECGEGKYHACSRPYFCDEFRNEDGDKYIAIQINPKDLFVWEEGKYPHKVAFRKGTVLYECDKGGEKI